jgi:hypothetical protein
MSREGSFTLASGWAKRVRHHFDSDTAEVSATAGSYAVRQSAEAGPASAAKGLPNIARGISAEMKPLHLTIKLSSGEGRVSYTSRKAYLTPPAAAAPGSASSATVSRLVRHHSRDQDYLINKFLLSFFR